MANKKEGFFSRVFKTTAATPKTTKFSSDAPTLPTWASLNSRSQNLTLDSALSIPTVYACVDLISTGVSQLTLDTYRADEKITPPLLVRQPDSNRSLSSFLKRTAFDLAAVGNAYWLKSTKTDSKGYPVVTGLEVLNPLQVTVEFSPSGVKSYRYGDKTYRDSQIKHLRRSEVPGHDYGKGPIQECQSLLSGYLDLRAYSDNWLTESGIPTGILSTDMELSAEEAAMWRDQWMTNAAEGGVQVTARGLNFRPLSLSASDVQFTESLTLLDQQIARAFRVDPAFLPGLSGGEGSSLTYANRQDLNIQFIQMTLMAYLNEIEDALSSVLPGGQYVKFNVNDFIRAYEATPNSTEGASNAQAA